MRIFDPPLCWQGAGIIFAMVILLVPLVCSFPLQGTNGIVNATVYGVMKYEYGDGLYLDISANDEDDYDVKLIDTDNKTYGGNNAPYRSKLESLSTQIAYNGFIRDMLLFDASKDTLLKGLKIVPSQSDPFYINWTGMPVAKTYNETLRFYGTTFEPNGMRWRQGNWNLDINVTNSANQTAEYNSSNFALVDQFGWVYYGEKGEALKSIPPRESLRFKVKVPFVSELSRPKAILFKGIKLDISEWT
jgi:hypothetical protein